MLTEQDEICKYHADLLAKYKDIFPQTFIECIRAGVTWLCSHNGITYQTSTMIKTDKVVYSPDAGILKIGLIDVDKPLSGLSYYDVKKVTEAIDNVSGNTTFTVELNYKTPVGIKVTIIPIRYFDPKYKPKDLFYTKQEINNIVSILTEKIDNIKIPVIPEPEKINLDSYIRVFKTGDDYNKEEILFNNGIVYRVMVDVQNVQEVDLTDHVRFNILYQPNENVAPQPPTVTIDVVTSAEYEQNITDDTKVPSVKAVNDKLEMVKNELNTIISGKADTNLLDTKADLVTLELKADKTEVDLKANISDVYTKQEADERFELKTTN